VGDLIQRDRLLRKQIEAEAVRELKRLYQVTAGFVDPEPPTEEQRRHMEEGLSNCE
jgi:hypothetical protein